MPTINPSSGGTTRKDRLHEGKAEATDTHDGIDLSIVAQLDARILFREVSRRQYRLFWILVLCLRAGCAVFLYITTRIYFFVSDPRMSYYAALVTPAGGPQLKLFGAAFATLAAVHCIDILKMLLCSLYSRDLAFEWPEDGMSKLELTQMRLTSVLFSRVASSGARITRAQWIQRVVVCFNRVGRSVVRTIKWLRLGLFHRTGIFGVESGYFHWRFLLREVSEIICQSIQVFSASQIVPSRTINRLLLGVVVCNCLSTPVIQFCCQRLRTQNKVILSVVSRTRRISVQPQATAEARPSVDIHNSSQRSRFFDSLVLERFLCVTIDLALDMCSSLAIPVVLFAPYYTDFDMDDLSFGADRLYDDVWFVTMVRTVQQVGVVSWFDLVLTWFPHYSIHASLHVLVGLIQPIGLVKSFSKSPSQALVDTSMKDLAMTTDMLLSANRPSLQKQRRRRQFARSETRGIKWLWMIQSSIVIWGLLLLASFIFSGYVQDAMSIPDDNEWGTYCQMHVRPWFAQKLACSVLYLDCFQLVRRHNGDSSRMNDAINSVLDNIEHSTLAVVIFAHCPALKCLHSFNTFIICSEWRCLTLRSWSGLPAPG